MFSCEFCENFKNTFFTEHLRWLLLYCTTSFNKALTQILRRLKPWSDVSEICDGENLWQWSRLKISLNAFRRLTILQKKNHHHHHHHYHYHHHWFPRIVIRDFFLACLVCIWCIYKRSGDGLDHYWFPLREKCANTEFFLVCIFPYLDWIRSKSPYSVWMRENKDQKKPRIWTLFTLYIYYHIEKYISQQWGLNCEVNWFLDIVQLCKGLDFLFVLIWKYIFLNVSPCSNFNQQLINWLSDLCRCLMDVGKIAPFLSVIFILFYSKRKKYYCLL